jgi:hypothetical protein
MRFLSRSSILTGIMPMPVRARKRRKIVR